MRGVAISTDAAGATGMIVAADGIVMSSSGAAATFAISGVPWAMGTSFPADFALAPQ